MREEQARSSAAPPVKREQQPPVGIPPQQDGCGPSASSPQALIGSRRSRDGVRAQAQAQALYVLWMAVTSVVLEAIAPVCSNPHQDRLHSLVLVLAIYTPPRDNRAPTLSWMGKTINV